MRATTASARASDFRFRTPRCTVILQQITQVVAMRMHERMQRRPLRDVERDAVDAPPPRGLVRALGAASGALGLIAELKKASPSAGVIRADFDVSRLAAALAAGGADALSVLTEVDHFHGSLENLRYAGDAGLPRLQKDFVLHEYQVLEGRAAGADAVLLIAEALENDKAESLCALALDLGMDVLFESHDPEQLRRAATRAERDPDHVLVGINNRDLRTFDVALDVTLRALQELPAGLHVVSESGIHSAADARRLRDAGACAILVGEALMRSEDVEEAVRMLLSAVRETG